MVGQRLGGRYELKELVTEEELGRVYTAIGPDGPVTVKVLKPLDHQNPERMGRFGREMMAAAVVRHPNSLALLDFESEGAWHYVVFEHVRGRRLSSLLAEGPLDALQAARIALGIARALDAAHREGILHRNLHSGNLLVVDAPIEVKVCDFGLCRLDETENDSKLTARGTRVGRPEYMAPEYVSFFDVSPRADLYALGILLFEMLVGQPPFTGTTEQVLKLQAEAKAPAPSAVRQDVPPWLDRIAAQLLQKDRQKRPADAGAVVAALEAGLATVPRSAPPKSLWSRLRGR
jgi:serine/threonine protein kinase